LDRKRKSSKAGNVLKKNWKKSVTKQNISTHTPAIDRVKCSTIEDYRKSE